MEGTTGSQPQEPPKLQEAEEGSQPPPQAPAPAADSDTGDDLSDEEDATGKRKKPSITHMLDEDQEEELADWWRDNPGLYDKCVETYRRNATKDKLIAEQACIHGCEGVRCRHAIGLHEEHADHVWQRKRRNPRGRMVLLPLSSPFSKSGSSTPSASSVPTSRLGPKGEYLPSKCYH